MKCNKCVYKIVLDAFSSSECENCIITIYSPYTPCDKLCVDCSDELLRCQSCGKPIIDE
jgi:hypothetical protein